jgi:hypothetical protein
MAAVDDILKHRWRNFAALQESFRKNEIIVGVDRVFARKWLLQGDKGCPTGARAIGYGIVAIIFGGLAGAGFASWKSLYLLASLCGLASFVGWRFLTHFAIRSARFAVLDDERLFRLWFRNLRLSVFVKSTGEYIWNNAGNSSQ